MQKFNNQSFWILFVVVALLSGIIGAGISGYVFSKMEQQTNNRIFNTYEDEMATFVSPVTVKGLIDKKDKNYILVDLRSNTEYKSGHIRTAVNIPAVTMNAAEIVAAFQRLPKDKEIIIHCYSSSCTLGRQIGKLLAEHGIYVKEMDVGWNEWRYHWDLWNPGAKPEDGVKDYIVTGEGNAGVTLNLPCTVGVFGC